MLLIYAFFSPLYAAASTPPNSSEINSPSITPTQELHNLKNTALELQVVGALHSLLQKETFNEIDKIHRRIKALGSVDENPNKNKKQAREPQPLPRNLPPLSQLAPHVIASDPTPTTELEDGAMTALLDECRKITAENKILTSTIKRLQEEALTHQQMRSHQTSQTELEPLKKFELPDDIDNAIDRLCQPSQYQKVTRYRECSTQTEAPELIEVATQIELRPNNQPSSPP